METNNTRQAAWLAIGSLFSFGFGIVSSMILSRYFDKADYGTYKQVLYIYHTILSVFTLGLPKAFSYFLPRVEPDKAKNLILKLTNLFFLLGGIFSLLLFTCSSIVADIMKNPNLTLALRIFSIVPVLMMPTMGLEGILATFHRTKFMTLYTVFTRIMMLLCVASPVILWGAGYIGSIIGFVISSFLSFLLAYYLKFMPVRHQGNEPCNISYNNIFKFSLPVFYASLWGTLIASTDQFFISRYYGTEVFADFSNGNMELPFVGMVVGACSAVMAPLFSKLSNQQVDPKKDIFPVWKSVFRKSAMLLYPLLIYFWVFADFVMIALYGDQYDTSYIYFRIKIISSFFSVIVFGSLLINIGKVKFFSKVHMYIAFTVILLELIAVFTINSPYAISVVSLLCQLIKVSVFFTAVAKYFHVGVFELIPIKTIRSILLPSILVLVPMHHYFLVYGECNKWGVLIISFNLYSLLYIFISYILKIDYVSILKPLIKR